MGERLSKLLISGQRLQDGTVMHMLACKAVKTYTGKWSFHGDACGKVRKSSLNLLRNNFIFLCCADTKLHEMFTFGG